MDNNGIDRYEDTDVDAYSRERDSLNMPNLASNVHPGSTLGYEALLSLVGRNVVGTYSYTAAA